MKYEEKTVKVHREVITRQDKKELAIFLFFIFKIVQILFERPGIE